MFCQQCGEKMEYGQACPKCGAAAPESAAPGGAVVVQPSMAENVAGLLCYPLGWITGIVFFLMDKRPFVRFHAMQSMLVFGTLSILFVVLGQLIFAISWTAWGLVATINLILGLGSLALAVFLMVQAYNGKRFGLPVVGPIAERMADKQ